MSVRCVKQTGREVILCNLGRTLSWPGAGLHGLLCWLCFLLHTLVCVHVCAGPSVLLVYVYYITGLPQPGDRGK